MVHISDPAVILTSLKPGDKNTVVLRVYESSGLPAKGVALLLNATVLSAHETNLMEDDGKPLAFSGGMLKLDFKPFEIRTIKLRLRGMQAEGIGR